MQAFRCLSLVVACVVFSASSFCWASPQESEQGPKIEQSLWSPTPRTTPQLLAAHATLLPYSLGIGAALPLVPAVRLGAGIQKALLPGAVVAASAAAMIWSMRQGFDSSVFLSSSALSDGNIS